MPKIKLTGVYPDKLGTQEAKRVEGTRIDNGETWSKKFFANNRELRTQLDDFGVGDNVDVQMVQDGKFWNIAGFAEIDPALVEQIANKGNTYDGGKKANPTGGSSTNRSNPTTTGGGSDKMSKAEWAAKDRAKELSIARAVALKAAVDNTKIGASVESIVGLAKEFVPYLLDEENLGADPLDPPTE